MTDSVGDEGGGGVDHGGVDNGGGDHLLDNLGVNGVTGVGDDSVETVVVIGGVVHSPGGAVGLDQGVFALDDVTVAVLGLALHVTGVGIMHSVLEGVGGMSHWLGDNVGDGGVGDGDRGGVSHQATVGQTSVTVVGDAGEGDGGGSAYSGQDHRNLESGHLSS